MPTIFSVAPSKQVQLALIPKIEDFLKIRGLEISKKKSKICNLWKDEVEFLGYSFKKKRFDYRKRSEVNWYKRKTKASSRIEILPTPKNQKIFKERVKKIVESHDNPSNLIIELNQYLRGWANYFSATSTSAEFVRKNHRHVLRRCWAKIGKLFPSLPLKERKTRFFPKATFYQNGRYVTREWVFSAPTKLDRPSVENAMLRLYNLDSVKAPGQAVIKTGLNAYITSDRKHLKKRVKLVAGSTIEKVSKRQKFECPICGQSLTNGDD